MDKALTKKLDLILDVLLSSAKSNKVGDFVIYMNHNGRVQVLGFSNSASIYIAKTKENKPEFEEIKAAFLSLYEAYEKFKYVIKRENIDFFLQFDYGGGSITLCKEEKGIFEYTK